MEQLIELLRQIEELAGVGIKALEGASAGAQAGAAGGPPPGAMENEAPPEQPQ